MRFGPNKKMHTELIIRDLNIRKISMLREIPFGIILKDPCLNISILQCFIWAVTSLWLSFLWHQISTSWNYLERKFWLNPLSANPTKWANTLKQFVEQLKRYFLLVVITFL